MGVEDLLTWDLGYIPDDELPALFENADALALPYREIDQSGVLMTAVSHGIPVLASEVGGFEEILDHEQSALLFDPDRPGALADCIERIVEDEALLDELEQGINAFARSIPSWHEIGANTSAVYQGAMAGRD
jgi:glycosyltransferase involved in cell wall biosynthesis